MKKQEWHSDIDVTTTLAQTLIEQQFPALCPIESIKLIGEGWDNKVYLVNEVYIFRFPHRNISVQLIVRENAVLSALQDKVSLNIPNPIYHGQPSEVYACPFHGYRALSGIPGARANLSDAERIANIEIMAVFLKQLHTIDANQAKAIGGKPPVFDRTDLPRIIDGSLSRINILDNHHISFSKSCFDDEINQVVDVALPNDNYCLVHGDLYSRHLFFENKKLTGVIDWGDNSINSPAVDLAVVYSFFPVQAHAKFFETYGEVDTPILKYARFIAIHSSIAVMCYAIDMQDSILFDEAYLSLSRLNSNLIIR